MIVQSVWNWNLWSLVHSKVCTLSFGHHGRSKTPSWITIDCKFLLAAALPGKRHKINLNYYFTDAPSTDCRTQAVFQGGDVFFKFQVMTDNISFYPYRQLHWLCSDQTYIDPFSADPHWVHPLDVITVSNLSGIPGGNLKLCSSWFRFSLCFSFFSVDLPGSGVSELLIICLIWFELPLSPPAWLPSTKEHVPPWNVIAWHDIKRNGNSNEACL